MVTAFVAADGSVTVPRSVRKALGLEQGGRIEFLSYGEGQVLLVAKNLSPSILKGSLPKPDIDCAAEDMVEFAAKRAAMASK
ncbi:AbrB/MazE/SpoVT family DNA-binding domain-containing protein [Duganella sp. BuS-21]|uniref:AbrB/MazE/SpoVT family DNA-binding domain-containing protein n=1 Tax=Duganella sp. BuS-21 TaxID=2943848 RepID=UPI0035A6AA1C